MYVVSGNVVGIIDMDIFLRCDEVKVVGVIVDVDVFDEFKCDIEFFFCWYGVFW